MTELSIFDIKWFISTHTHDGNLYLGGARHPTTEFSDNFLHNLLNKTTKEQMETGITKYRCGYIYNSNATEYLKNPILFIVSDTASPSDFVEIGWGTAKIGTGVAGDTPSIEQTIATQHTQPANVSFFKGANRTEGAILRADIPPLKGKAFWVKLLSTFNAQAFARNNFRTRLVADNLYNDTPPKTGVIKPPKIEFPVIGEGSSDIDFMEIIKKLFGRIPDFWVTTGNNNVDSDATFFVNAIQNYVARMLLAFGNRDTVNQTVRNTYFNAISKYKFAPIKQKRYYAKTFGNIHILIMDTSGVEPYNEGSDQYNFIKADLSAAKTDDDIDWIFVVSNRAMYSSQTTTETRFLFPDLRDTYHKLFTENNVLVLFQGTFRFYDRSKVLKYNDAVPATPITFDYDYVQRPETPVPGTVYNTYTISGQKSFPDGFICINCGTAGATHDVITSIAGYSQIRNFIDFGFPNVIIDNTNLAQPKITLEFYSTSRIRPTLIDDFTVIRTS